MLEPPGDDRIAYRPNAVRVGDHHRAFEETRFFDPGCPGHLAVAVLSKPSREDGRLRVLASRQDCGHAGPYYSSFLGSLSGNEGRVAHFDPLDVGDGVQRS